MKPTPEKIYLLEVATDEYVWCDSPDPDAGDDPEVVEYIRADCAQRRSPCENLCEARAFEIEIRRLRTLLGEVDKVYPWVKGQLAKPWLVSS